MKGVVMLVVLVMLALSSFDAVHGVAIDAIDAVHVDAIDAVHGGADPIQVVEGLIQRWVPSYADVFQLELIDATDTDVFEIQSNGSKIVLRGNTGVNIASALNYYLKYYCNCHISWSGNQLQLPVTPPQVASVVRVAVPMTYRYYFNVCTFGYTTVWWDWTRWQQEIDWMALNGINFPLAFTGQETVWRQVYLKLGLTDDDLLEFFTGPAFLPWQRMGNVNGWGGGLPISWLNARAQLQLQILSQMRALGMKPILPAFAGHVPLALKSIYPTANITQLGIWNTFNGTYFLDPTDPLFNKIGTLFITLQTSMYGTDHYYNMDLFNEEVPPNNSPTYLASISKATFASIYDADNQAVWVMQGWFLVSAKWFWQAPQAKAFLSAVPASNLVMLDLWAEINPVWNATENFFGIDFIWCMLHNFGGRSGIYGAIKSIASNPAIAYSQANNMVGMGLTPESIETNVILYDLMMEMPWRIGMNSAGLLEDLDTWVQNFTTRRYGVANADCFSANTIYDCHTTQSGTTYSFIAGRPALAVGIQYIPYYDTTVVPQILQYLVTASSSATLAAQSTFQHGIFSVNVIGKDFDNFEYIASVTRQLISDAFLTFYVNMLDAFDDKNTTAFTSWSNLLLQAIYDMDTIVGTQEMWLVGQWIENAKSWGTTSAEIAQYEFNARNQLTLWGPYNSGLHDYAYKLWGGLVHDFYYPRWALFVSQLSTALQHNSAFDYDSYVATVELLEYSWSTANNTYPTTPTGNAVTLSAQFLPKYQVYM